MPSRNTIPDFTNDLASMATALRAMKDVVEQLAGLRQGASLGAPQVFLQPIEPRPTGRVVLKSGDFWISAERNDVGIVTVAGNLHYWDGAAWRQLTNPA